MAKRKIRLTPDLNLYSTPRDSKGRVRGRKDVGDLTLAQWKRLKSGKKKRKGSQIKRRRK